MPDVTLPPRPALVVIPAVPLIEVGEEWPASTGPWTVTPDDIAAAVAAQDDPAVRSPIIRLGHVRVGQPAFGRFTNLRATNNGMTLVGDLVGAPAWLADVLPYAFPSRSVEATINQTTETGHTHACRIDAVALLGVELPAISTLDDVAAVYTAASMEEAGVVLSTDVAAAQGGPMPRQISAALSTEDIRRQYYDQLGPAQTWWWIREMQLDPLALIVDDDEGGLWRIPVTINGDIVAFGAPESVRVEYVPTPAVAATSAASAESRSIVFADRAASREGVSMDPIEYRRLLGLPEDATDEQVRETAAALLARPEAVDPPTSPAPVVTPPTGATVPEGAVLIDAGQLAELQSGVAAGRAAAETLARQSEDAFVTRIRAQGRLGPTTNPNSQRLEAALRRDWQRNPGEAEAWASTLAVVAPVTPLGYEGSVDGAGDQAFDQWERSMFPDIAAVRSERDRKGS